MVDAAGSIELTREESPKDSRTVTLRWDENGIEIETYDIGESVERFINQDDYEFSTEVKSEDCLKLLVALIREKYKGSTKATDELAEFCKANGIPYGWSSWP